MRKSLLSLSKQHRLIEHFVAGTTARCAADLIDVNRNTAAYYFYRLRKIISTQINAEASIAIGAEIEVDESYFGGHRKGKQLGTNQLRSRESHNQRQHLAHCTKG